MKTFWQILGYISIALAIFIGGWQLSDWYKGEIIHVKEIHVTDTLFVTLKVPDTIDRIVYVDKIIHRIDTVYRITERERIVEICKHDTVWYALNPKWLANSPDGNYSELPSILRADREVPEIVIPYTKIEKREWWEDMIYLSATIAATYGAMQIE